MIDFTKTFEVRWSDLDPNVHVRHSAYPDYCAAARIDLLNKHGFGMHKFAELQLGPVLFKETTCFLKELLANDRVKVNMTVAEMSDTGHKWTIHHELFRESDGEKVATVTVEGAWMSMKLRKITPPPEELLKVFESIRK